MALDEGSPWSPAFKGVASIVLSCLAGGIFGSEISMVAMLDLGVTDGPSLAASGRTVLYFAELGGALGVITSLVTILVAYEARVNVRVMRIAFLTTTVLSAGLAALHISEALAV